MAKKLQINIKDSTLSANVAEGATENLTKLKVKGVVYSVTSGITEYLKTAGVSGNTLTLTKQDGSTVVFTPAVEGGITDVIVNGSSVVDDGVATIEDMATTDDLEPKLEYEDITAGSNIVISQGTGGKVIISATNIGSLFTIVSNWISPMPANPAEYDFDTQIKNYITSKGITKIPVNNDYVIVTYPANATQNAYSDRCVYADGEWIWEYRFVGDVTGLQEQIDDLKSNKISFDEDDFDSDTLDITVIEE